MSRSGSLLLGVLFGSLAHSFMPAADTEKSPRSLPAAWLYRTRQFFAAAFGSVSQEDMAEAREVLGPDLYSIFDALPGQYRHHMLKVYRRLKQSGCEEPDAMRAALLHDAGKYDPESGRYVFLPYRVAVVLLASVKPGRTLLRRLSSPGAYGRESAGTIVRRMGWRYPFYLNAYHARLGADQAARHGASQTVVRLVAGHHGHSPGDPLLAALQSADEKS